jgi:hypothetical protein
MVIVENEVAFIFNPIKWFVISCFRRKFDEVFSVLGYYAMSSGNPLPAFRDNQSVPSSTVKKSSFLLGLLDP